MLFAQASRLTARGRLGGRTPAWTGGRGLTRYRDADARYNCLRTTAFGGGTGP